jgi:Domain of unknown function (DUF1840)
MYTFKSKAAADVLMLKTAGDELLRLIGHEPCAKGIVQAAAIAAALQALEHAVATDENKPPASSPETAEADDSEAQAEPSVSLRQRAWPLMELMKRSMAAGEPVVWGV